MCTPCIQECCLCTLRGGALKPTVDGHWAHVVCALAIKEVKFGDIQKRENIDVSKITSARLKLVGSYNLKNCLLLV